MSLRSSTGVSLTQLSKFPLVQRSETVLKTDPRQSLAVDLQYDAKEDWEYAIDPSTLKFHQHQVSNLPSPVWDYGLPPVAITATACLVDWPVDGDMFAASPPENPDCVGPERVIVLSPFGVSGFVPLVSCYC